MVSQLTKKKVQSPYHGLQGSIGPAPHWFCNPVSHCSLSFNSIGLLAMLGMRQASQFVTAIHWVCKVLLLEAGMIPPFLTGETSWPSYLRHRPIHLCHSLSPYPALYFFIVFTSPWHVREFLFIVCLLPLECNLHQSRGFVSSTTAFPEPRLVIIRPTLVSSKVSERVRRDLSNDTP